MANRFEGEWDSTGADNKVFKITEITAGKLEVEYPKNSGAKFPVQFDTTAKPARISFSVLAPNQTDIFHVFTGELLAEVTPVSGSPVFGFIKGRFVTLKVISGITVSTEVADSGDWTSTRPPIT